MSRFWDLGTEPMTMPRTSTLDDLLNLLDPVATGEAALVLLPNSRAARDLRSAFDVRQHSLGRTVWKPAPVLSWTQWINSLWSELIVSGAEPRLLLNAAQEHSVWREIIAADPTTNALTSPHSLADLARSAWQLAASYNATHRLRAAATTHDTRIFADWAATFSRYCATRGYLSSALLDDALRQHLESRTLTAPKSIHLAGFDDLTPAQDGLVSTLREHGTEVIEHRLLAAPCADSLRASTIAANKRDELVLAARWIRTFLETHVANACSSKIAVLLPNLGPSLAQDRAELESVFREILAPELQSIAADLSSPPWEIAGGAPLSTLPMIAAALDLARWAAAPLPIERVSSLLLSPYMGNDAGHDAPAQFDAYILRRSHPLRPELSLTSLLTLLESPKARALSSSFRQPPLLWPRNLHTFLQRSGDLTRPRSFADWTEVLRDLLRAANWPCTANELTAAEFAATETWDSTLDLIATLDFSGRRILFATFLEALERQTQTTLFSPPPTHAPVQVMSLADSAGSVFDAAVVLHATDANWPPPQRANPLLPWTMQCSLHMPGTDPAHTAARARAFTSNLLARSSNILFTSAAEDADGHLRPSPLLTELNLTSIDASRLIPIAPLTPPIQLDFVLDDTPLPPLPSPEIHGGSSVLKAQAACGFRAFAEFRLNAAEPELTSLGLDAADSGSSVHRALQHLWKAIQTQKNLRSKTSEEREQLIAVAIDNTMSRFDPESDWERAYIDLQKQRLRTLLRQWLEAELQRGDFTVLESEITQPIDIGPLTLKLRLDRIDKVANGFFVVDYKTGASGHPKQWDGERPDDPQLPLYALLHEPEEIQGLAFAKVRAGEMHWLGLQAAAGLLPASRINKVVELHPLLAAWRDTLTQLAHDFAAGHATVSPKRYPQTCTHCGQRLLCRLDPATLLNAPDEDNATAELIDG